MAQDFVDETQDESEAFIRYEALEEEPLVEIHENISGNSARGSSNAVHNSDRVLHTRRKTSARHIVDAFESSPAHSDQKRRRTGPGDAATLLLDYQDWKIQADVESRNAKLQLATEKFQWKKAQQQQKLELAAQKLQYELEERMAKIASDERIKIFEINNRHTED